MAINDIGQDSNDKLPINPKVIEIVRDLDSQFWETYGNMSNVFPDTPEGDDARYLALISAVASIASNYILCFQPAHRSHYLETLVEQLRIFEKQFRDFILTDNSD